MKRISMQFLLALTALIFAALTFASNEQSEKMNQPFSGLYGGFDLSYNDSRFDQSPANASDKHVDYGVTLGWRYQTKKDWVVGTDLNLNMSNGDMRYSAARFELDYHWNAGLSLGRAFGVQSRQLAYAKAGVGGVEVSGEIQGENIPNKHYEGAYYAFGYEYLIKDNIGIGFETAFISYDERIDFEQTQLKTKLIYHF